MQRIRRQVGLLLTVHHQRRVLQRSRLGTGARVAQVVYGTVLELVRLEEAPHVGVRPVQDGVHAVELRVAAVGGSNLWYVLRVRVNAPLAEENRADVARLEKLGQRGLDLPTQTMYLC